MHSYHATRTTNKTNRFYILLYIPSSARVRDKHKTLCVLSNPKKRLKNLSSHTAKKINPLCAAEKETLHCSSNVASTLWSFCSAFVALSSLRSPLRDRKRKSERTRARERSEKENEFGYIIHFSRRRRRRREEEEQVKKSRRKTRSFER